MASRRTVPRGGLQLTKGFTFAATPPPASRKPRGGGVVSKTQSVLRSASSALGNLGQVADTASAAKGGGWWSKLAATVAILGTGIHYATPLTSKLLESRDRRREKKDKTAEAARQRLADMAEGISSKKSDPPAESRICADDVCEVVTFKDQQGRLVAKRRDGTEYDNCVTRPDGRRSCRVGNKTMVERKG